MTPPPPLNESAYKQQPTRATVSTYQTRYTDSSVVHLLNTKYFIWHILALSHPGFMDRQVRPIPVIPIKPMMRIVPNCKSDDEACRNLKAADDSVVIPHIRPLLQCLQDLNWPVAAPVAERLASIGMELVEPILEILHGDDDVWKYWIVSHLLYEVNSEVYLALKFKLNSIRSSPTKSEREEEVYDAVCELLRHRKNV